MWGSMIAAVALLLPTIANAQARGGGGRGAAVGAELKTFEVLNVEPSENVPRITNAPFTADATTEFVQVLSDGNRIEQRFTSSLARDGRGRTRSERQIAWLGRMAVFQKGTAWNWSNRSEPQNEPLKLVVIADPIDGASYTLDQARKEARRTPLKPALAQALEDKTVEYQKMLASAGSSKAVVESLGTRQIDGVAAEGIRSTTTIPAGEVGNLNPIQLVTERWFSKELQMAVLITRRDPRSGDTTYRLTNIVRAEPPPDLFTVPTDYRVVDVNKKKLEDLQLELKKIEKLRTTEAGLR